MVRGVKVMVAVFAAGLVAGASPALGDRSTAMLYWTVSNQAAIGRAEADGSAVDRQFLSVSGFPEAVAADDAHLYWTDSTAAVNRARLDGSGIGYGFIEGDGRIGGVAVDGRHVYWSNRFAGSIGRARLDGSGVDQDFIETTGEPGSIDVDDGHIYWASLDSKAIGRARLNGSDIDADLVATLGAPTGIAVADDHLYWVNAGLPLDAPGSIGRAGSDGSDPDQAFATSAISSSLGYPLGVAVDGGHLYWTDWSFPSIVRADLDGSGVDPTFIDTGLFSVPSDVAVAPPAPDVRPPDTRITHGPTAVVRRKRARFAFGSSEPGSSFECRRDGRRFRPCTSPKRLRRLRAGRHRFAVRATDPAGNVDRSPARSRFRVQPRAGSPG